MKNSSLETLGWDSWFEEQARLRCDPAGAVARVAAVDRDQLLLLNESGAFRAKYSGKYKYEAASSMERPCVGDWVCVEKSPAHQAMLTSLRSRLSAVSEIARIPTSQAAPF